jgi:polysaccharide biosynthesis protein PelF
VPVIGWVGRLDRKKRVEDVLAAAALLSETSQDSLGHYRRPDFFYPEHEAVLHDLAARLCLGSRVRFLGDRADVPRLLAGMDALVWLSEGEGMPHVLAEAGAAALPVVASATTAPASRSSTASGLFVPKRHPAAAADGLIRLIDDPILRRSLATACATPSRSASPPRTSFPNGGHCSTSFSATPPRQDTASSAYGPALFRTGMAPFSDAGNEAVP